LSQQKASVGAHAFPSQQDSPAAHVVPPHAAPFVPPLAAHVT
jgi:hypothetical protein